MTLASTLVERTRRHLWSETRPQRNRLNANITDSAETLTLSHAPPALALGHELSIGLEEMYVWAVSGNDVTVSRGENGTTAAAHSTGDLIEVNPKFSTFRIFDALNEEIAALSSSSNGLFQIANVDLTYDSAVQGYDLTAATDVIDVYEVKYDSQDSTESWPIIPRRSWRLKRDMDTADFASGIAIVLYETPPGGRPVRISYKTGFSTLSALTDNVETVTGLPASAVDIPPLGAAMHLLAGFEVPRNFTDQGDTRRADEVPAGARAASVQNIAAFRRQRVEEESAALLSRYPVLK